MCSGLEGWRVKLRVRGTRDRCWERRVVVAQHVTRHFCGLLRLSPENQFHPPTPLCLWHWLAPSQGYRQPRPNKLLSAIGWWFFLSMHQLKAFPFSSIFPTGFWGSKFFDRTCCSPLHIICTNTSRTPLGVSCLGWQIFSLPLPSPLTPGDVFRGSEIRRLTDCNLTSSFALCSEIYTFSCAHRVISKRQSVFR